MLLSAPYSAQNTVRLQKKIYKLYVSIVSQFRRCESTKKKVVVKRKKMMKKKKKKIILSPQRKSNRTSEVTLQRKPRMDKKAVLKSKIQDILSGKSRFVIWKVPAGRRKESTGDGGPAGGGKQEEEKKNTQRPPAVSTGKEEVKQER